MALGGMSIAALFVWYIQAKKSDNEVRNFQNVEMDAIYRERKRKVLTSVSGTKIP